MGRFEREHHAFETSCPLVREERIQAMRWHDASGGLGIMQWAVFEHSVLWVRRAQAQALLLHSSGHVLVEGSTFHDSYYRLLTCVREHFRDADPTRWLERFGCGPDSELEIQVSVTVEDTPCVRGHHPAVIGKAAYIAIPDDWKVHDDDMIKRLRGLTFEQRMEGHIRPCAIAPYTVWEGIAWSSRDRAGEHQRMDALFTAASGGLVASDMNELAQARANLDHNLAEFAIMVGLREAEREKSWHMPTG
jgi:hypothetical protein